MYRQINFFVVLFMQIHFYYKGGDIINFLVNLFFISFIINSFIVFYSIYIITDKIFFKNSHMSKFNIPN